MGLVLNPVAFRVGHVHSWLDAWYLHRINYPVFMHNIISIKSVIYYLFFKYYPTKYSQWIYSHLHFFILNNKIFISVYLYDSRDPYIYYRLAKWHDRGWFRKLRLKRYWTKKRLVDWNPVGQRFLLLGQKLNFKIEDLKFWWWEFFLSKKDWGTIKRLRRRYGPGWRAIESVAVLENFFLYIKSGQVGLGWNLFLNKMPEAVNIPFLKYLWKTIFLHLKEKFKKRIGNKPNKKNKKRLLLVFSKRLARKQISFIRRNIYSDLQDYKAWFPILKFNSFDNLRKTFLTRMYQPVMRWSRKYSKIYIHNKRARKYQWKIRKGLMRRPASYWYRAPYFRFPGKKKKKWVMKVKIRTREENIRRRFLKKIAPKTLKDVIKKGKIFFRIRKTLRMARAFSSFRFFQSFVTYFVYMKPDGAKYMFNRADYVRLFRFFFFWVIERPSLLQLGKLVEWVVSYFNIDSNVKVYILDGVSVSAPFIARYLSIALKMKFNYKDMIIPLRRTLEKYMYMKKWKAVYKKKMRDWNEVQDIKAAGDILVFSKRIGQLKEGWYRQFMMNFVRLKSVKKYRFWDQFVFFFKNKVKKNTNYSKFWLKWRKLRNNFEYVEKFRSKRVKIKKYFKNRFIRLHFTYSLHILKKLWMYKFDFFLPEERRPNILLKYEVIANEKKMNVLRYLNSVDNFYDMIALKNMAAKKFRWWIVIMHAKLKKYFGQKKFWLWLFHKKKKRWKCLLLRRVWKLVDQPLHFICKGISNTEFNIGKHYVKVGNRVKTKYGETDKIYDMFLNYLLFQARFNYWNATVIKPFPLPIKNYVNYAIFLENFGDINIKKVGEKKLEVVPLKDKLKRLKLLDNDKGLLYGYKFAFVGRFSRKQRAAKIWFMKGSLSVSSHYARVEYGYYSSIMKFSLCTVKVWLYKGFKSPRYRFRVT